VWQKAHEFALAVYSTIAQCLLEESRYYLILAEDLGYADTKEQMIVLEEVSRFLEAYVRRIPSTS